MNEDPELPDFDSMSQEELIEWLEALTKLQSELASDARPERNTDGEAQDAPADADDDWSGWLDEAPAPNDDEPPEATAGQTMGARFQEDDEDGLARVDQRRSGPLDADEMAWLAEISAAETEEDLPDITDYKPPDRQPENLGELLEQGGAEDPLEWLEGLGKTRAGPRLPSPMNGAEERAGGAGYTNELGDDFDDEFEDDERLNDLEDESLYSRRQDEAPSVRESLLGLDDSESEEYSTQSMAPVPDQVQPEQAPEPAATGQGAARLRPKAAPAAGDSLAQAFTPGAPEHDLEAWYADRLRAIAGGADGAAASTAIPILEQIALPTKPPPPGLAAAIFSARGKVEADDLGEALAEYETLLRRNAGLAWIMSDMRALIEQDKFRGNPAVHRVLGDALMRQGHLQAALDVYRHALTLL